MKLLVYKKVDKNKFGPLNHNNRMRWVILRGRDYQLMLSPNPKETVARVLLSHRGPRTSLAARHR